MRIIQLTVAETGLYFGLMEVLPRASDEHLREAHRRYTTYHSVQVSTGNLNPLSFEEWARENCPELGIRVLAPDTLLVTDNVI